MHPIMIIADFVERLFIHQEQANLHHAQLILVVGLQAQCIVEERVQNLLTINQVAHTVAVTLQCRHAAVIYESYKFYYKIIKQ